MVKLQQGNKSRRYTPGTPFSSNTEDLQRYVNGELNHIASTMAQLNEGRHEDTWTDLRFPLTQTRQGALLKPDFDYTNVGLLFPRNDATEIVYIIGQMPHEYRPGTPIRPHIHWQQSSALVPTWVMQYKWFNIGASVPAAFTTISTSTAELPYVSGNLHQISAFAEIDGTGVHESSTLLIKLYRNDNVVVGDVLAFEFDIHYIAEKTGTVPEFPT